MLNSETLEVAIGMSFLFLSVSFICSAIKEWLEGIFKWRAMDLERALRTLLTDPDGSTTSQLLRHPMLDSLFQGHYDPSQLRSSWLTPGKNSMHIRLSKRRNLPSYIPSAQFAVALLDCVARGPIPAGDADEPATAAHASPLTVESLRSSAMALASPALQRTVLAALDHSGDKLAQAQRNIERWFDGTMDRSAGWYKRRTQAVLFMLGLAMSALLNIDALHVMQRLTSDKAFREAVVNEAAHARAPDAQASGAQAETIATTRNALASVGMPIGWREWARPATQGDTLPGIRTLPVPMQLCTSLDATPCKRASWLGADWFGVLCGWLLTAFAVTLGAPFWFDVLNRFMIVRSTVKPHEKSPEEASIDRQSPPSSASTPMPPA